MLNLRPLRSCRETSKQTSRGLPRAERSCERSDTFRKRIPRRTILREPQEASKWCTDCECEKKYIGSQYAQVPELRVWSLSSANGFANIN